MRLLAPLLLALLAAPHAAAQAGLPPTAIALTVEPSSEPARPEGAPVHMPVVLRVHCDAPVGAGRVLVEYGISRMPAWANVAVSPTRDEADLSRCVDGEIVFEATLIADATSAAPAFVPEPIELHATVTHPLRDPTTTTAEVPLHAGFVSILDVTADTTQTVARGDRARFDLVVTNFGNANTRVDFEIVRHDPDLRIITPQPVVLGSRLSGASDIDADIPLLAHAATDDARPLTFELRWVSSYAFDAKLRGASGTLSFTVLPRGSPLSPADGMDREDLRQVPAGAVLAAALGLALAAMVRGRR